jgi:hypothetical protein
MTDIWDSPDMKVTSEFVKFDQVGTHVAGTITDIGIKVWDDGGKSPQLTLNVDGEDIVLTANQYRLKAKLAELRPQVGDWISVTFTGVENLSGGRTAKNFDVEVRRNGVASAAATATATPAPAAAPAAPAADPLAGLTEEQRAAVLALGKPIDNDRPPF